MDRCTYHGWEQRKLKSVAISAGTMPRNKSHFCFRIALSRQLSREERDPRLNKSMWLKVGQEAVNVGYLEASSWNECEEDLCLIKPNGSSCWWASSGRGRGARLCLPAGTPAWQVTGSQQWQEGAEWATSEWQLSWCGVLGKERENNRCLPVLCHALRCCALSLCWQCQFSNSLLSSLFMESLEGDDFLYSFFLKFFFCLFIFFGFFFLMQSSLFLLLS